ncbi:glycoside hydrolase family 32 protein [Brachybacterium phenoliresistens]|uniref:glycoside hydrolase family 32 protein n=1 Tax=Brachybacterium phenoliresistens TaxID=396014 RepID=UPI0031D74357
MTTTAPPRAELHRPQFHLTPDATWMNDPNGLILHEGTWHAFFQNNPSGSTWGNMSWGHAVSEDLATWRELPVALPCREGELIFSGSVVHDAENSSGLGTPGEPGPLVAIYTSAYTDAHPERAGTQAQSLAVSRDGGTTWQFHSENPVLDRGSADFRDPKVFRHAATGRWVMVAVEAVDHSVLIHTSTDLRRWELASTLTDPALDGGIWECPDLVRIPAAGSETEESWALIVSTNPGGPAGGSGTYAILGGFSGRTFTPAAEAVPLDLGQDCYAAVSFGGVEGAPVLLGWMNNWDYAELTPTGPWRSAMTLPRTLELAGDAGGAPRLVQRLLVPADIPVVDLGGQIAARLDGSAVCVTGVLDLRTPHLLSVRFGEGEDSPELRVEIDAQRRVVLDRGAAHREPFAPGHTRSAPFVPPAGVEQMPFRLVLDASTAELELDGGRAVISQQIFPGAGPTTARIEPTV